MHEIWILDISVVNETVLKKRATKFEKIHRLNKSDLQKYFRFDHRLFWSKQKLSEMVFQTTYISIKNFLFCTVLPPGAYKVDQTRKYDVFLNLTQLFSMTPYIVLVGMNNVKNVI